MLKIRDAEGPMRFLIHWLMVAAALWIATYLVPGVRVSSTGTLLVAALVLGLVNALVRPILFFVTLPITVVTLGLFYLVVNGLAFGLAAALVPGFTVSSFTSAVLGALVVSVVSWILGSLAAE
jgi:putative membrane protein